MGFSAVFSQNILLRWLTGRSGAHDLSVTMSGVRLGERLLQVGLADGRLLVALASKTGLSGRSCGVDPEPAVVQRVSTFAEKDGVLVELQAAEASALPFAAAEFDVVVVNLAQVPGVLGPSMPAAFADTCRVLRAGGRCVVIAKAGSGSASGNTAPAVADVIRGMRASGFKAARVLAERGGLAFSEGVRAAE